MESWEKALVRNVSRATTDTYCCPRCSYRFSVMQSRGIACVGCRNSTLNCPNLRCPRCDHEFGISNRNDLQDDLLMRGISSLVKKDMKKFGERFG